MIASVRASGSPCERATAATARKRYRAGRPGAVHGTSDFHRPAPDRICPRERPADPAPAAAIAALPLQPPWCRSAEPPPPPPAPAPRPPTTGRRRARRNVRPRSCPRRRSGSPRAVPADPRAAGLPVRAPGGVGRSTRCAVPPAGAGPRRVNDRLSGTTPTPSAMPRSASTPRTGFAARAVDRSHGWSGRSPQIARRTAGGVVHEDLGGAGRQRAAHRRVHVLRHHGAAPPVVPAARLDVDHAGPYVL